MAKLSIVAGATSQSVSIFIQDSTVTTGAGKTGLVFNTSGLIAYYVFNGANGGSNAITLATLAAANSAFSSGGFKEIDATNMPGCYRLDIPNAAIASSKGRSSVIMLSGATGMVPCLLEIELTAIDNQVADSARTIGTVTTVTNQLTAAAIATGVWQDTTAGDFTTASSIGKSLYTSGVVPGGSAGLLISGTNSGTTTLGALTVTGATTLTGNVAAAAGVTITQSTTNGAGLSITGNGSGAGILSTGGATGHGISATSGATSGNGLTLSGGTLGHGLSSTGVGTSKHGATFVAGGTTANGILVTGGSTSGAGIQINTTSGDGISSTPTAGHGITATGQGTTKHGMNLTGGATTSAGLSLTGGGTSGDGLLVATTSGHGFNIAATGTSKHGITATGGNGGTSDGIKGVAGTGGVDIRGNITGNLVGTVSTLTTYTGNTVQTGDSYARLGAPTGASVSADIAAIKAQTNGIASIPTSNPSAAIIATTVWQDATAGDFTTANSIGKSLYNAFTSNTSVYTVAALANAPTSGSAPTVGQIATAVWQDTTAGDFTVSASIGKSVMNGVALGTGLTINAYTGDTPQTGDSFARLGAPAGASIAADLAEIEAETDGIAAIPTSNPSAATIATAVLTTAMTESYPVKGATITLAQGIYDVVQHMGEENITGTTKTILKRDQVTAAKTFTINDATNPSAVTEAT